MVYNAEVLAPTPTAPREACVTPTPTSSAEAAVPPTRASHRRYHIKVNGDVLVRHVESVVGELSFERCIKIVFLIFALVVRHILIFIIFRFKILVDITKI